MMKDLYSAHASEQDLMTYYEKVKGAYSKIFERLGLKFVITEASGGVFTTNKTHEFQVLADSGEDAIYFCDKCSWGQNKEIFEGKTGEACPSCKKGKIIEAKSIEVGNIFPFGTYYSGLMRVYFTDAQGKKKPVWFGSYGIGSTRAMGAWVEVSHDDKGIIWSKEISPFAVHLIELEGKRAKEVYTKLTEAGVEVLWDDRDIAAGEKFADCDLIGIPVRLVVSEKTKDKIEWKERASKEISWLTLDEVIHNKIIDDAFERVDPKEWK